jgi:hypothetical protein
MEETGEREVRRGEKLELIFHRRRRILGSSIARTTRMRNMIPRMRRRSGSVLSIKYFD